MRFTSTIFLLLLNLATFGLILVLQNDGDGRSSNGQGLSSQISRQVIEANQIEISGPSLDAPRILKRNGSDWFQESPVRWPANYFAVNRILNQLQFLEEQVAFSVNEINSTGQTLADYGLDNPSLLLRISGEDSSIQLKIGSTTEIGANVYILGPKGKHVHVVSNELIDSLLVSSDELRNRKVFNIPVFEVEALGVHHINENGPNQANLKVHLRRTTNGWRFESPLAAEADPALVSITINTLASLKVDRFVPEKGDAIRHGLNSLSMKVTLFGNKRQQTLFIGNRCESSGKDSAFYAKVDDNPTIFTVEAKPFDELRIAQQSLRERKFMNFNEAEPSAINVLGEETEIRLRKLETNEWQVIKGDNGSEVMSYRASQMILEKLIKNLKSLSATGFAYDSPTLTDLSRLGFDKPKRTLQLIFQNDEPTLVLELAHPKDDEENLYARTNRSDYIYRIDRDTSLAAFPLNELYYRSRILATLPEAARIASIQLIRETSGETLLLLDTSDESISWKTHLAKQPKEKRISIETVLNWIRRVEIESLLANHFEETYPQGGAKPIPWVYRLDAEIQLPGGGQMTTETHTYYFSERISGTSQIGASRRHEAIFNNPIELIEALDQLQPNKLPPPEVTGQPVPDPVPLDPIPKPQEPPTK
ncbi:MAG: DUF4340 domain-containing protein [Coraliomargaritaceae bacterium]